VLLTTDTIHAGYGSKEVLHGVSIAVATREIVAFIGHNGAGKSTLLKAIFGIVPVTAGRVLFDGADVTNRPPYRNVRDGLAYCLQGGQVFSELTVEDNLKLGREAVEDAAADGLDDAALWELFPMLLRKRRAVATTLSGGERQLLALAMTLLARPRLCLLDEPSAGLAPLLVEQLGDLIQRINRELGVTILLVEQNVGLAMRLAHRVYVQANGRVVFAGTPAELQGREAVRAMRGF
jgi:branched-chain amino acid transport system ATP-binding protein